MVIVQTSEVEATLASLNIRF